MSVLKKLTIRNLKLNRKRTITTIIGIMLSTALICATFGLGTSFQKSLLQDAIKSSGDYHATFYHIPKEEQKYITENRQIDSYFITQDLGYAEIEKELPDSYNRYWLIKQYDEKALTNNGVQLVEGRLPENENEILIQDRAADYSNQEYHIGDMMHLKIGERYSSTGEKLGATNPLETTEDDEQVLEKFVPTGEEKEYKIVGIMKRPSSELEPYYAPFLVCITYLPENKIVGDADISVKYKDVTKAYEITEEISKQKGEENSYEYITNGDVLRWSGVSKSANIATTLYVVVGIIVGIIIFSSVFVIRNSFRIMITEKYRQYGMLASIGATSKQIKRNVLQEAFYLGAIAIPLGILGSLLAVFILVLLVQNLIGEYANMEFTFYFPWMAILIGTILSIVTIYLSSIIPARKAAKISPIEAIRSNTEIKINRKKIQAPKWVKKLFKIGGLISYKNLKRSKKQYRTTVISIVVSIAIFLALTSIIQYAFGFTDIYYYENIGYNIVVRSEEEENEKILQQYNEISKIEGIEQYSIQKMAYITIGKEYDNKELAEHYGESQSDRTIPMIAIEDKYYDELVQKLGISKEEARTGAILADNVSYYKDNKYATSNQFTIKEGETIKCYQENLEEREEEIPIENKKQMEIKILKRLGEEQTIGIGKGTHCLIVTEEFLQNHMPNYRISNMYIQAENPDEVSKELNNMEKIGYTNYNESLKETRAIRTVIYIFVYGFIAVITLIGVTNIFNTITTNMLLRSKEFAMLKSVGMTAKEFNNMIRLESIFYGLKSLIIGLPIGLLLSYALYKGFGTSMEITYQIPWASIGIAVLFVFIIVFITMKYSLNKINKQNIIETIRNDNI